MSSTSSCPRCSEQVSLPLSAQPDTVVRCPLCEAEYSLSEILDQLPPMLVVVGAPAAALAHAVEHAPAAAFAGHSELSHSELGHDDVDGSEVESGDFGQSDAGRSVGLSDEFGAEPAELELDMELDPDEVDTVLEEEFNSSSGTSKPVISHAMNLPENTSYRSMDAAPEQLLGSAIESQLPGQQSYREAFEDDGEEIGLDDGSSGETEESVDFGEAPEPAFAGAGGGTGIAIKPGKKRKRREPSMIGNLIGVVGGGVIGLGLGYYILLLIGGPGMDHLSLAGKYYPLWLLPSSFSAPKEEEEPAPKGFSTPPPAEFAQNNPSPPPKKGRLQTPSPEDGFGNLPSLPDNTPAAPSTPAMPKPNELTLDNPLDSKPEPAVPSLPEPTLLDDPVIKPPAGIKLPKPAAIGENMPKPPVEPATTPDSTATVATTPPDKPKTDDIPPPEQRQGLKTPVVYSVDDLTKAAEAVAASTKAMNDAAAAGGDEAKKAKRDFYMSLYRLAEVATFAGESPTDPLVLDQKNSVQQMATEMGADPTKFAELGKIASQWISRPNRVEHEGVVVSGQVQGTENVGKLFQTKVLLAGTEKVVAVLSDRDPGLKPNDQVVVLGSIVDGPNEKLVAYNGDQAQVVWSGMTLKMGGGQ